MIFLNALFIPLLFSSTIITGENCNLTTPPDSAGETQAHGVILYIYPRSHTIGRIYNGCQNQWFVDDDNFRKLSVIHYKNGVADTYDNINLYGDIGYRCRYIEKILVDNSDSRCPEFEKLRKKTYQAGCYSLSKLNSSGSYEISLKDCILR